MLLTMSLAAVLAAGPEITVYNQGFGLVKETRRLKVPAGRSELAITDVAALIDPTSVSFVARKDAFRVLEQNYRYDLVNAQAILAKSVGGRVRLIRTIGGVKDVLEGTLLSAPTALVNDGSGARTTYNGVVIRTDDGRIVLDPTGEIEVLSIPEGMISRPTLVWDVEAPAASEGDVDLSYITQGMSWSADYVLTLLPSSKADLQGWVTMNNQSGATFKDAKLKLLAGEVNVARPNAPPRMEMAEFTGVARGKASDFAEESLFEYHLYTLDRPATLRDKETKQLSLLQGQGVPFMKRLVVDSLQGFGRYLPNEGEIGTGTIKPLVQIEFRNDKKSNLGMPLPAGRFRVYQRDASGSTQLLGEDRIDHTPREEKLTLNIGRSFDVVAERKRTEFTRVDKRTTRERFEIEVRNRKAEATEVTVIERRYGDWKVIAKSQEFVKADANTAVFTVRLAPNETRTVDYTVETKF